MDSKGQIANIASIAIAALVFIIVVVAVFGQVFAVTTGILQTNSNVFISGAFNTGVMGLIDLLPLVLIGAGLLVIVIVAFRLAT